MRQLVLALALAEGLSGLLYGSAHAADSNADRGQAAFRACAACHSLEPDRNMTGPSLAGLWGRKAGSLSSFRRYSPALKSSDVVWNDQTLDPWLQDPVRFIPGNRMTFPGIKDPATRADLIAFLKEATAPGHAPQTAQRGGGMGGMMGGMMGSGAVPNLKKLDPAERVQSITYCQDTYRVATAAGETHEFWERNLRFKSDSSADGPARGAPAIVAAGMMGDRADVIFASPEEFDTFIKAECPK